ncbi:MAG: type II toxin-antitoxin system VapC family toxin [Spirochaetota bacterium]
MIVADASAVIEILLNTSLAATCRRVILEPEETVCVPHLLDVEVCQVLRRYVRNRQISDHRASVALADLRNLPLSRYGHEPLAGRIWELRHSVSAYDAAYLALAEAVDGPLVTCDARLGRSHGHRAVVRVVGK